MINELLIIVIVSIFLLTIIVSISYFAQKMFERRFNNTSHINKRINQESFSELSLKLKSKGVSGEISNVLNIHEKTDLIVMLAYLGNYQNVLKCDVNGNVLWRAELPEGPEDVYVEIEWKENQLVAYSFSCYQVVLDIETGKILSKVWTK